MPEKNHDWRPRVFIDLEHHQVEVLQRCIPWGIRKKVFTVIIEDLIEILEGEGGELVVGALLSRYLKLQNFLKLGGKNDDDKKLI